MLMQAVEHTLLSYVSRQIADQRCFGRVPAKLFPMKPDNP
jgi:hypothetical protein